MRVLILGGTGIISTGITRLLVARGDAVAIYNRGRREADFPSESVERILGDRRDTAAFESQMAEAGTWDAVIDMIAYRPADIESAIRAFGGSTGQYLFCSTVDVYTKPAAAYPVCEDAERRPARSFAYAHDKAQCERILESAHARGALAVTIIRPAWTYGEGGTLLHTFGWGSYYLDRLRKGLPIVVHGDGTSLWAACHRDDVARAFVAALGNEATVGRAYHIAGEEALTWDRITEITARACGGPRPQIIHIPTDLLHRLLPTASEWCVENFHYHNLFDTSLARRDLGFRQTIPFTEGARRVVAWLDAHGGFDDCRNVAFYDRLVAAWVSVAADMQQRLHAVEG